MAAARSQLNAALEKSAVARYIQLAAVFRRRISSGEWTVDQKIPTVVQLSEECGVAGMTIRQALDLLEQEGLIERFRAKGTFVRRAPQSDLWCEVETEWKGLLLSRDGAEITVLEENRKVELPSYIAQQEASADVIGTPAKKYRHLKRLHQREGETFLFANVYIDEKVAAKIDRNNFSKITALKLVTKLRGVKVADARQILTVDTADVELSDKLNLAFGEPVVNVLRIALDQHGTIILAAQGHYRGDRVRIDMKLMS